MVFIVPQENKDTFCYQSNLGDILQFMCFDDPVVSEDILMSEQEKKKWIKSHKRGIADVREIKNGRYEETAT